MIFNLSGKQVQLSDSFSNYAKFETKKCIFKYDNNPISTNLKLSKDNHNFSVNIIVYLTNKMNFSSISDGKTAVIALNNSLEKLSKQLRRYKRKLNNYSPYKNLKKHSFFNFKNDFMKFSNKDDDIIKQQPLIFAEIESDIEILSVKQAVKKLLSNFLPALMFRNINHSGLNMIYKRNDGMIGWVDPRGLKSTIKI